MRIPVEEFLYQLIPIKNIEDKIMRSRKRGILLRIGILCGLYGLSTAQNRFPQATSSLISRFMNERLGYCLSSGGDINRDGFDDLLVGTYHYNVGGWDRGAVFVVLGGSSIPPFDSNINYADAKIIGHEARDALGTDLGFGDINGDGYSDFLIGTPAGGHPNSAGWAYVIFGKSNVDWGRDTDILNVANVILQGENPVDLAGGSVAVIPDMNDDGCDEFLVSSYLNDTHRSNAGKVYFFKGRPSGEWNRQMSLNQADAIFTINQADAYLGSWVSDVGDINNDGIEDFAMAARGRQRIYVMYGRRQMDWGLNFNVAYADVTLTPEYPTQGFGTMIARAGDVNNDGFDDLFFSDVYWGSAKGKAYLIFGRSQFESVFSCENATASFIGENTADLAGFWISGAGDFNLDGKADLLIGAPGYDSPPLHQNGKTYLLFGKSYGWARNVPLSDIKDTFTGSSDSMQVGESICSIGDMNGDDAGDIAVSAPYFSEYWWRAGKVFLFHGVAPLQIRGFCRYESNESPVFKVEVGISGDANDILYTDITGEYVYEVESGGNYRVTPYKPMGEHVSPDAITSYDASLIARGLVGLSDLTPDQLIFADVNQDGIVNMFDAACIARYVVGLQNINGVYTSEWRFTPPFREYTSVTSQKRDQHYRAIVLGNVSGNWSLPGESSLLSQADGYVPFEIQGTYIDRAEERLIMTIMKHEGEMFSSDLNFHFDPPLSQRPLIEKSDALNAFMMTSHVEDQNLKISLYGSEPVSQACEMIRIELNGQDVAEDATITLKYRSNESSVQNRSMTFERDRLLKPRSFSFEHNYPNPFNASTVIRFQVPETRRIRLRITNVFGQHVVRLVDDVLAEGHHSVIWDGKNEDGSIVGSGLYFCEARIGRDAYLMKLMRIE